MFAFKCFSQTCQHKRPHQRACALWHVCLNLAPLGTDTLWWKRCICLNQIECRTDEPQHENEVDEIWIFKTTFFFFNLFIKEVNSTEKHCHFNSIWIILKTKNRPQAKAQSVNITVNEVMFATFLPSTAFPAANSIPVGQQCSISPVLSCLTLL